MANKYTWSINKMVAHTEEQGFIDVVYSVDWDCFAEDENGNSVSTNGTQLVPFADGENFKPVDQLTLDVVVQWVKDAMGDNVQASIKEQLDALLKEKVQPKTVEITLPWMSS